MINIFMNTITKKMEKQYRLKNEVEILKKKQQIESEKIVKDFSEREKNTLLAIQNEIDVLQSRIKSLEESKTTSVEILNAQLKVRLDEIINNFGQKITLKQNAVKRYEHVIGAEQKMIEDAMELNNPRKLDKKTKKTNVSNTKKQLLLEKKNNK